MKNKKYKNKKVGFQNCLYLFQFHKKTFYWIQQPIPKLRMAELLKVFFHKICSILIFSTKLRGKSTFEKYIGTLLLLLQISI